MNPMNVETGIVTETIQARRHLPSGELYKVDAYWRAANYLSVGQIHLYDNPLLRQPLNREHGKPRLLGHWGTTPGLNFIYVHLNRVISKYKPSTTPFDMVVLNDNDRFHLVIDVIRRVPNLGDAAAGLKRLMNDRLIEHKQYSARHGQDMPDVRNWRWGSRSDTASRASGPDTAAEF
jgi:phosphoketolase